MANKQIKTTHIIRNDTLANWTTSNPIPLKGEACVVFIPDTTTDSYNVKTKYGDGVNHFNDLPYSGISLNDIPMADEVADGLLSKEDFAKIQALGYLASKDQIAANDLAKELKDLIDSKVDATFVSGYAVTMTALDSNDYAKVYTFTQNNKTIGTVNIPKDMVISSGIVETKASSGVWGEVGTYLVLTLANSTNDKIYINVGDLIEYVTSGSAVDDQIFISVSADHKVTATLKNSSVTKDQLVTAVQNSLNKADTALQSYDVTESSQAGNIKVGTGEQAKDVPVHGLLSLAYKNTVGASDIDADAVTAVKIAEGAVETSKIADSAVTDDKIDALDVAKLFVKSGDTFILDGGSASG